MKSCSISAVSSGYFSSSSSIRCPSNASGTNTSVFSSDDTVSAFFCERNRSSSGWFSWFLTNRYPAFTICTAKRMHAIVSIIRQHFSFRHSVRKTKRAITAAHTAAFRLPGSRPGTMPCSHKRKEQAYTPALKPIEIFRGRTQQRTVISTKAAAAKKNRYGIRSPKENQKSPALA